MNDRTEELLGTLQPAAMVRAWILVYVARVAGIPLHIISGARSAEVNRDVGGAEKSYHLSGNAFDVQVGNLMREQIPWEWWEHLGEFAERELGLFWGGRIRHAGSRDVNHFDTRRLLLEV